MMRSIVFSNSGRAALVSRGRRGKAEKAFPKRLFGHSSAIVGNRDENSNKGDRRAFMDTILMNDELHGSMVYSLAMGSLEGSKFPPLARGLNEREREQLRISRIQQRQFRSDSAVAVEARQSESELPPLASTLNKIQKEQLRFSREQIRHDHDIASQQLCGDETIGNNAASLFTTDTIENAADDYDDDFLSMSYSLSFASSLNEGSVNFPSLTRSLTEREANQLHISKNQLLSTCTYPEQRRQQRRLPQTLQDALNRNSDAIVITETKKPFRVYNVNAAWEGLCGYTYVESKGKSLGSLLAGEETDSCAVTALIHQLFVHGEEATTVLTNYTKEGRKFRNRLSVGPLYDEETKEVSHFVGVLKEVTVAA